MYFKQGIQQGRASSSVWNILESAVPLSVETGHVQKEGNSPTPVKAKIIPTFC